MNTNLHTTDLLKNPRHTILYEQQFTKKNMVTHNLERIHVHIYSERFCLAPSHLAYQRLASLSDMFGSLRKPTERAEADPYTRTFAHKKIRYPDGSLPTIWRLLWWTPGVMAARRNGRWVWFGRRGVCTSGVGATPLKPAWVLGQTPPPPVRKKKKFSYTRKIENRDL